MRPEPAARRRDAERTRAALLDAALAEFGAKGFAGARVNEIADRAGVNKQLISYYFGGKDGLYRALVERWLRAEQQFADPALPLDELVVRYFEYSWRNPDMSRLFLRDGLDGGPPEPGPPADDDVADLRRRRQEGEIAPELDPACLLLMLMAAVNAGVLLPDEVRRLTGLEADSEAFRDRFAEQLRLMVRRLGAR